MGSATANARRQGYVAALFAEIARIAEDPDPDIARVADLLGDAIAHPDSYRATLMGLSEFVLTAYQGSVLDPEEIQQ